MRQTGTHTWNIIVQYHLCPQCHYIIESREDYVRQSGKCQKNLVCGRCKNPFTITKPTRPTFGPLWGKGS